MKKQWICLSAALLLLTGCGAGEAAPVEPYTLEIEYGESGVAAEPGAMAWDTGEEQLTREGEAPFDHLSEVPFVNEGAGKNLKLLFDENPDSLEVRTWTSEDGYQAATQVENAKARLPVPTDGASYLYEVTGTWDQGSCTYYFRYLPRSATGDQSREAKFYNLVKLEPKDLFGAEITNHLDAEKKTCRDEADVEKILNYLKKHLSTNFHPADQNAADADYALRLAATDGTQYEFSYGGEGKNAWIAMDGQVWEAGVMDLYSLWQSLAAESIPLNEDWKNAYLQVCDELPKEGWGDQITYAYLRELGAALLYDEMLLEAEPVPEGEEPPEEPVLTLKRGKLGQTLSLSEDCQYWIRKDHTGPWCQVPQGQLWQWSEDASYDMLFALYVVDDQVVAICEQEKPQA